MILTVDLVGLLRTRQQFLEASIQSDNLNSHFLKDPKSLKIELPDHPAGLGSD